ncbi:unnamed protein product [Effrenium voratum]|nr:unnamed protein product [Effrenium voratum]
MKTLRAGALALSALLLGWSRSRSFLADGAGPNRRQAAAASLAASLAPLAAPGAARAESMEEAAAAQAASRVSVGLTGDDLVLPAYFAGDWAVAGELYKVETGPLGQGALTSALPGVQEALRKNSLAVGAPAGEFRARRRWKKCSRTAPGGGAGVEEDKAGLPAGAAAAAYAIGGPTPRLKPLGDAEWDVAGKWRLQAAGAVARSDPEMAKALRVSELFEVRPKDGGDLAAAVRVVTIWRESSAEGAEQLQESLKEMGEAEKGRNLLQAVQIVSLLPEPASSTENNFASVTTRFVYSPIRA